MISESGKRLREGDAIPQNEEFFLIDRDNSSEAKWFLSKTIPIVNVIRVFEVFETLEEAILYAESLGKDYGIAKFEVDFDWLNLTKTVRRLRRRGFRKT